MNKKMNNNMSVKFNDLVNSETAFGEPQWWLYGLDRDRSLEVTHEEYGLSESEQFYSCIVHCSDVEYENGDYDGTNGIIDRICIDNFDYEKIIKWANMISTETD